MNIERRSIPTKLDTCPQGTLCTVNLFEEDSCIYYIQTNEDEENPKWEKIEK